MNSNFVDIVGYQFEKVHTGTITWLLDSNSTSISQDEKYKIFCKIYELCDVPIPFECSEIKSIKCKPESPIEKRKRVDLVIDILLKDKETEHIVIEMKVDTIATLDQLKATYNGFHRKANSLFLLFLFGSSQICEIPKHKSFNNLCLDKIISIFNNIKCSHYIYQNWIESLQSELKRGKTIKDKLVNLKKIKNKEYWRENGYRTDFTAFYYLYHHLKSDSKNTDHWSIYSGKNNPIMNWNPGWLEKTISDKTIKFYWEFNYESLVLKVKLSKKGYISPEQLHQLKENISSIAPKISDIQGRIVRKQSETMIYNSLYKWKFNFLKENFEDIMKKTEFIINNIHPQLETSKWKFK
ncbi:TPA: PD-(D/E)XK nuclease family protein [Bacillus cereus]